MTRIVGGSESRRPSGFPAELTSFVGRRDEAADVRRLLSAGRLLTLTGPGGVGKTRLAGHVAGQVARAFPDGVWLVPLAALSDEAFVPHAVNDVLGVRNETVRPPLEILVDHLRGRRLLIVLDNCEHLLRSCAVLAGTVLAATEGVRILATSRHRLGLAGEQLFEVPPLPAPAPEELTPSAVESFPALRLFADRAAAVVPGFTVGEANQQAVARLCRRLDGLPLAIELAAVRVRALGVEQLVERLDDRYQLLTCGSPTSEPRHRTLRSAVDWSHELCTPQEQLVWAWLSVFVGGFDLAAAEAVCAGADAGSREEIAPCAVLDAVAGLVDKSVLVREEHAGQVRYRLLVSLRDYGLEKLNDLGEATDTRRRHRDHFARLGAEYEQAWFGPDQAEITERLRIDQDNFRAALDFCLTTPGEAQHGLRLAGRPVVPLGRGRHLGRGPALDGRRPAGRGPAGRDPDPRHVGGRPDLAGAQPLRRRPGRPRPGADRVRRRRGTSGAHALARTGRRARPGPGPRLHRLRRPHPRRTGLHPRQPGPRGGGDPAVRRGRRPLRGARRTVGPLLGAAHPRPRALVGRAVRPCRRACPRLSAAAVHRAPAPEPRPYPRPARRRRGPGGRRRAGRLSCAAPPTASGTTSAASPWTPSGPAAPAPPNTTPGAPSVTTPMPCPSAEAAV